MNNHVKRQINNLKSVNNLIDRGYSLIKACKKTGICKQTYYNIVNKYGKNLEDLNRKLNKSSERQNDNKYETNNYSDSDSEQSEDIQLFKSDGTPLEEKKKSINKTIPRQPMYASGKPQLGQRASNGKNAFPKDPSKRKPVEKYSKEEIDDELGYFFKVYG